MGLKEEVSEGKKSKILDILQKLYYCVFNKGFLDKPLIRADAEDV